MKTTVLLLMLAGGLLQAADLSEFGEGDAQLRARLSKIQDAPAPEIQLTGWLNSKALHLADLKGKIVVLDFWATWCGPCLASIPHTNELAEKYAKDVVFIGVCHPRGAENMKKVVEGKGIHYAVAVDPEGKVGAAYAVNGYPDYYIIDRNGKVVLADCGNANVGKALEKLLRAE